MASIFKGMSTVNSLYICSSHNDSDRGSHDGKLSIGSRNKKPRVR